MKLLKKTLVLFLVLALTLGLAACAMGKKTDTVNDASKSEDVSPMPAESPRDSGYALDYKASDASGGVGLPEGLYADADVGAVGDYEPSDAPADSYDDSTDVAYEKEPQSGLITASAWNENINYDYWLSLFADKQNEDENGKFLDFLKNHPWGFDSTQRVTVTVKAGDEPVCGAVVTCVDQEGNERFAAKTGADGVAYLFPETKAGTIKVTSGENIAEAAFEGVNAKVEVELDAAEEKQNIIKLMLVIDVTGSMGDELSYLQAELDDVIHRVAASDPETKIDLALLFYRDTGDAEKFAYYDFVNVNNEDGLNLQLVKLGGQMADGGGDYPEAVDEALEMAMAQAWGDDNSTKVIFHLLDAPPHENTSAQDNYEQRYEAAVRRAAAMGIRICPITCSGADLLCEYVVRQAAIYTGGTFIFVTDHSGIGGEHLDPDIPDAVVENLNDLMVRLVKGYHTGVFEEPVEWKAAAQDEYKQ